MLSFNVRIRNRLRWIYVLVDLCTTNLAMLCFNYFRWQQKFSSESDLTSFFDYYRWGSVWGGQLFFPLVMMFIYWLSGYYNHVERRSRAQEIITTFGSALLGALVIFFLAVVNDFSWRRSVVFENISIMTGLLFTFVYIGRFLITRIEVKRVHNRHHVNDAVVIGSDSQAIKLARRINELPKGMGINVSALVKLTGEAGPTSAEGFDIIEHTSLQRLLQSRGVGMMILSPGLKGFGPGIGQLMKIAVDMDVPLFISPDINSVALASHRSFNVLGEPLVCVSHPNISDSTANVKRMCDILVSATALTLLLPFFALIAAAIKLDSKGPVFFLQTRLGRGGKQFRIIKFRSMIKDAETQGTAQLTADDDPRVTRVGRFLRKYRIDEFPQFWNVIRGEMSLVGPRPERKAFADQIAQRVPVYPLIYQVRPGITSWGMVRYGYASTVDEMVERLRYDLIYLETISISTDLKIMLHTLNTVISGRGK